MTEQDRAAVWNEAIEASAQAALAQKTCGCNGSQGSCMIDDPYDDAADAIRALKLETRDAE